MEALVNVINWAFGIIMALAVLVLIYAGILFVTARGDDTQIKNARGALTYAIVGVVVALLARGLVGFIQTVLD